MSKQKSLKVFAFQIDFQRGFLLDFYYNRCLGYTVREHNITVLWLF